MPKAVLIDTTKCIGCRSCQVTCKEWNGLPGEKTRLQPGDLGLQNPVTVSGKTLTLVTYHEIADDTAPGNLKYVFAKRQCMHCDDPACASACPVTALHKTALGPVVYDSGKCIGCRYCVWACPFGAPTVEWESLTPKIRKCTMCYDRITQLSPAAGNGSAPAAEEKTLLSPACVKQCPAGALSFGERDALLAEAKARIKNHPGKYVDHIYGEHEAGGTSTLYLASVPFSELGFPQVRNQSYAQAGAIARNAVPPAVLGLGAVLGGSYALYERREAVALAERARPKPSGPFAGDGTPNRLELVRSKEPARHVEFAPSGTGGLREPVNLFLLALTAFGGLSFLLRFIFGLGSTTNLSDTYPWGLWIAFLLIRIAISAGSFVVAGLIYVGRRKDLYPVGRTAVFLGALSYASVLVTLIADIGRPWNFWQLLFQSPSHSAMYEVAWCVALYFTILLVELLPIPFERWATPLNSSAVWGRRVQLAAALWRRYSPPFVVVCLTAFVFLMSRNLVYTGLALVLFALLAYAVRAREGEEAAPALLAIAGIVFATMHQSSLGALFLPMPDKLDSLWWSPAMPLYYLFSSLAAGTALVVLIDMWIAKGYKRTVRIEQLAFLGKVTFLFLLAFDMVRIADVVVRGQLPRLFSASLLADSKAVIFLAELVAGGIVPLVLLASGRWRRRPAVLGWATLLVVLGVVFNRTNAVFFGMNLKGAMPQIAPQSYFPSVWEWGLSIGMVAAAILTFRLGARMFPVLAKESPGAAN